MDDRIVDATVEFLSVAFHNILYYASVYPKNVFEKKSIYNIDIFRCLHPEVNEKIDKSLESIAETFKNDELHNINLIIKDEHYKLGPKVVFEFIRRDLVVDTTDETFMLYQEDIRAFCLHLTTFSHEINGDLDFSGFDIYYYTNESFETFVAENVELVTYPYVSSEEEELMHRIVILRGITIANYRIDVFVQLPKNMTFCS